MGSSSQKLELRIWAKAQRARLPDVSSLVCGHLVQWLEVVSQVGEHTVRPYEGIDLWDDTNPDAGDHKGRPYKTTTQTVERQKNSHAETAPITRRGGTDQPIVLSYKAFGSEISLETLPQHLPHLQFLTTRVSQNHTLTLHDFSSATQKNRYDILEPPPDTPAFAPELVDVALIPGLAFTKDGTRLGYGGGFYDRLLPHLRPDCLLVGVTQTGLLLPELPLEPHDVPMQFLALETGVINAKHLQIKKV